LYWDCTEEEFADFHNKKYDFYVDCVGAFGKTVLTNQNNEQMVSLWIGKKYNMDTLSHELLHVIRFWLQDFLEINLCVETEEVYTMLHSFYMKECLIAMGLDNLYSK